MNIEEFSSKIGSIPPFEFHLLDNPLIIKNHLGIKVAAFALAWVEAADYPGETRTYALAVHPSPGHGHTLKVLRQFGCPSADELWDSTPALFFKNWIQAWVISHPQELVKGGMIAARAKF